MSESAQNEMREKEARVHEELMGFCVHEYAIFNEDEYRGDDYRCGKCGNELLGVYHFHVINPSVPRYGSDPAAMMVIIEKFEFPRMRRLEYGGKYRWNVQFVDATYRVSGEGYGDTMQEAVLNAAIAWLEAKKEGQA